MSLNDIRAREQAATEGPWLRDSSSDKGGANFAENVVAHMWDVARCSGGFTHPDNGREEQAAADADFIANARSDIPKLIAALDAVLALHGEDGGFCDHCGGRVDFIDYPCPTVQAITEALR